MEPTGIDPGSAKRGQHLTVTIRGTGLAGVTTASFGSGVTVEAVSALSDMEIKVEITIDASADLGRRDVSVTSPCGTATMTGGFEVVGSGGGVCSGAAPGTPSGLTPLFLVLGLGFGVWYLFVRRRRRTATGGART